MTYKGMMESLSAVAGRVFTGSRVIAIALVVAFTAVAMQPAHAQSSDTWKSVAIIGGSTAAGALIGHEVAGRTGAVVGAGAGAAVGYAIDRRRRQNEYNNQYGYYPNNGGYYPSNGGYYPANGGYYPSGGYYPNGGGYGAYSGGNGYQSQGNGYASNSYRQGYSQRRPR
ncbi:MAG: hypothetical protein ACRD3E_02380 [Terriglobales bacterium]